MRRDEPKFWLIVSSPENYSITRSLGFKEQGIKSRHRKKTETMSPGDQLLWYLTGDQVFVATARVTSEMFEERSAVWKSLGQPDDYPWRVRIEPELILDPENGVPASDWKSELRYLKKWPSAHWRLGFQGMLHLWPEADFQLIRNELRNATG